MRVIVIGGGPAGMMSAYVSAENGNDVVLIEKNEKLGKKLYITGKGRCNITNDCSFDDFTANVITNPKFIMSSFRSFSSKDTIEYFESHGLKLKTERGNRVFPLSDKSSDVIKCFEHALSTVGVKVFLNEKVQSIVKTDNDEFSVKTDKRCLSCDKVVVCTGGVSYPLTGSTGDGYKFAKSFGHNVVDVAPSLVGFNLQGNDFVDLQGLSLKNVKLDVVYDGKTVFSDFGEMLFTHFGVSGPIVLSSSCHVNRLKFEKMYISIDLKPALTESQLDDRLQRDFLIFKNKDLKNSLDELLPKSIIPIVIARSGISPEKKINNVTKAERENLLKTIKGLTFKVQSLRDFNEAIVTSGGIDVKEINPKTMESKLVKGLFFAGEVLDIDAYTGGFNIQLALSTGHSAGGDL